MKTGISSEMCRGRKHPKPCLHEGWPDAGGKTVMSRMERDGDVQGFSAERESGCKSSQPTRQNPLDPIFAEEFLEPGVTCWPGECLISLKSACLTFSAFVCVQTREIAILQEQAGTLSTLYPGAFTPQGSTTVSAYH